MTKIALICDTHWGARGDSQIFAEFFNRFYYDFFFPYLTKNNISRIFHLGDIVDRRKYINYMTARHLRRFFEKCTELNMQVDAIVGNHDTTFKNINDVNSMRELFSNSNLNIKFYDEATEVDVDGTTIAMLPWICSGNYHESMEFVKNSKAQILFGHLEIAGFEMYKGSYTEEGLSEETFNRFEVVCSGHFHHKSTRGNINYLGAPYEMTWSDYDDERGFHIFDTETRELTFIRNPFTIFEKIYYRDEDWKVEDINKIDYNKFAGKYVKLVIENKTNPYFFNMFVENLEKVGPANLQIMEDYFSMGTEEDSVNETEDTLSILRKVTDQLDVQVDKKKLDKFLEELYNEALSVG